MEMGPLPLALAMVISDAIWVDPGSGKKTILGTFSAIISEHFPLIHPQLAVYIALTDARGKWLLKLRLIDADEVHEPIKEEKFEVEFADPIMIGELMARFTQIAFPTPGEYRLQLFGNDELIIERRIVVMPIPEEKHHD